MRRLWKGGTVIYPLPAVMVTCGDMEKSNIVTIAWTGIINTNPPKTYISLRKSRYSFDIIKKSSEFVINLTTESMVKATDLCGVKSGRDVDKWRESGLTRVKSEIVACPTIKESPMALECKIFNVMELGSHFMFMADIVGVTVEEKYFDENDKFNFNKSKPICYSHGQYMSLKTSLGNFGFSVRKKKVNKKIKK
ncbi:MAG: flavin reductase family protein [Lachnospirales bacterium]